MEIKWGSEVEKERRRRIFLALWAYAYEFEADSLVDDAVFDEEASKITPAIDTGNTVMDSFFKTEFQPHTGQWIHKHPDLAGVKRIYKLLKEGGE